MQGIREAISAVGEESKSPGEAGREAVSSSHVHPGPYV